MIVIKKSRVTLCSHVRDIHYPGGNIYSQGESPYLINLIYFYEKVVHLIDRGKTIHFLLGFRKNFSAYS